jgi:hypothetical protein
MRGTTEAALLSQLGVLDVDNAELKWLSIEMSEDYDSEDKHSSDRVQGLLQVTADLCTRMPRSLSSFASRRATTRQTPPNGFLTGAIPNVPI